ncbi:MAG TPA: serine/threonine-protein kinase [Gemmatimonadales bacterium]
MIADSGSPQAGATPERPRLICPRCRVGEVTYGTGVCGLCGYAVATGEVADDPVPATFEESVRRDLGQQFRLDRLLGRGGMSVVYLARELELNRFVALKVLPLHFILGPEAADRFKREAKIGASLDHPHIIPVLRIGSTQTVLWYSMRWAKGGSLRELLDRSGPLSVPDMLKIVQPVASALHYAHQRGVVHRDVKPANVLVDEAGWVSLCDFGIAKLFGAVPLTQTGATIGTPGYLPPEQCYGKTLDGRADQYSLAIVTYECLTGALPFTADSLGEIVRKHCMEPPPRASAERPDIPDQVAEALMRAMSKRPEDRFENVVEFVRALGGDVAAAEATVSFAGLPAPELSSAPTQQLERRRTHRLAAIGGALAGAALVFTIGLGMLRRSGGSAPATEAGTIETPTPATVPGYLWVSSNPWGYLFVDGQARGATPQMRLEVPPGRHRLRIARDGYQVYQQDVEIGPGDEVRITGVDLRRSER